MRNRNRYLLTGLLLVICGACVGWGFYHNAAATGSISAKESGAYTRREDNPANFKSIDSAIHMLKDGDLALRTGADATSVMLRQMNLTNKTYSHCGIVLIEDGYPFVYHSIGGEDNPDARLRRDSACVFFTPVSNERLGIARLDLTALQKAKLGTIARRYLQAKALFDMDFDLATDDKLYCAEFVYKAVREATADTAYFHITHLLQRSYVGVDNLYEPQHAAIVCDVRYKL